MTESQFEENYPRTEYNYVRTHYKKKGTMGQTEIEHYEIIKIDTGEIVLKAVRTEHTNLRDLDTTISWNW